MTTQLCLKALLALSLAMNVAVVAVALRAAPEGDEDAWDDGCVIPMIDLSAEDRGRVQAARGDFAAFREAHRARMDALRERLALLVIERAEPNRAQVNEVLDEMARAQGVYQQRVIERVLAVRAVLSPEHRVRFDELLVPRMRRGGALRCD